MLFVPAALSHDSLALQIGRWIDAAVPNMPRRAQLLLAAHDAGVSHPETRFQAPLCIGSSASLGVIIVMCIFGAGQEAICYW